MAVTSNLARAAMAASPRVYSHCASVRDAVVEWRKEVTALFEAEVAKEAARLVEQRLAGPYTHKYKGVAVTEEQFWGLMKTEGFELPERKGPTA